MNADLYSWKTYPETESFINNLVTEACEKNEDINRVSKQVERHTSTLFKNWIESFTLSGALLYELETLGYTLKSAIYGQKLFVHTKGVFPSLRVFPGPVQVVRGLTLKVESLSVFRYLSGFYGEIDGTPGSNYSRILLSDRGGILLFAAEKNAEVWMPEDLESGELQELLEARNLLLQRRRFFDSDEDGWKYTERLIDRALGLVGRDRCASLFLEQERRYWEARNTSARVLKARQDKLGLGWGNHDHHTFRNQRKTLHRFIHLMEMLGFKTREKFFVSDEKNSGWGVQILEQPGIDAVVSVDVDITPEELDTDFTHNELGDIQKPGRISLWTSMHGESIFEAGIHHLGVKYDYDALKKILAQVRIDISEPFTDLSFFKQAYVHGERWIVTKLRQEMLRLEVLVNSEYSETLMREGALGSFLECTQRVDGYKGFSQR